MNEEIPQNSESIVESQRDETGKFLPGHEKLGGREKGSKNFDTIFEAAIRKIVEEKKINIDDPEREMVVKAVIEALKGNLGYYRDLMDRKYGKATENINVKGEIETKIISIDE